MLMILLQNAFTEDVVKAMQALNKRPIIFPLSNPVSLSEVDYQDAVQWSVSPLVLLASRTYSLKNTIIGRMAM
jgi:malate dehydrogenase (oxaloacetate-decarboxylating)(NADP+)